ncbi:hypothetical protein [Staphylococcus saprophyticus]|uniref:hypothetical protein n=1 Tax=Staphylococcus saprophyticus TaxID=29385 RepID=UPI002DBCDFD8|nr:hypothetical protein [Staphylococcus saprophyticus]MEB6799939.1 hypothetical protein [Staphylococcus saprophyticus]
MSTLKEICKEQTEMIDEMRRNIKELTEENEKLSEQYNKMLEERNSLIDDLSWYKAKVSRLERDNEQLKESRDWDYEYIVKVNEENKRLEDENEQLKKENEMIDEQFTDYIDETCGYLKLLSEFSQHIGNKPSSSTYKCFRAKLDGIGIKEGE